MIIAQSPQNQSPQNQSPQPILKKYWGYDNFRSPQLEIIETLLAQNDALIIMPTGGGKSICFQVPALIQPGLTIVISPLIALMEDQVQALRSRKIPAALLHNQMAREDRRQTLWQLQQQRLKLLYLSPETLLSPPIWQLLCDTHLRISSLILDEAHCLTQWGDTFRPAYCRLGAVRSALLKHKPPGTRINLAAFTATADPMAQQAIIQILQLEQPQVFQVSPYRDNLFLQVRSVHTPQHRRNRLQHFIQYQEKQHGPQSGLIYVRTRRASEELTQWLKNQGFTVEFYHAGLSPQARRRIEQQWLAQNLQFVVCTNAFGMGIDHPKLRWIVHFHAPLLLTEYLQEIGRSGRDGQPARALMLVSSWLDNGDRARWQYFQNQAIEQQKAAQKIIHQIPQSGQIDEISKKYPGSLLALAILQSQGRMTWHDPHRYEIHHPEIHHPIAKNPKQQTPPITNRDYLPDWLNQKSCRWQSLLQAFGCSDYPASWQCGHCDRCCR